jgi:predicted CoA-binding protein
VPVIAIIGASTDRRKYGNKAVRAFARQGYDVVPIHPSAGAVEGLRAYASVLDVPGAIDEASIYVPAGVGIRVLDEIARKGIRRVWLNPGADDPAVVARARQLGLDPIVACSIMGAGESPTSFD